MWNGTGSQWRTLFRSGVTWSYFLPLQMSLTAVLSTDWSPSRRHPGMPASRLLQWSNYYVQIGLHTLSLTKRVHNVQSGEVTIVPLYVLRPWTWKQIVDSFRQTFWCRGKLVVSFVWTNSFIQILHLLFWTTISQQLFRGPETYFLFT